jgi:type VI secretion system protein
MALRLTCVCALACVLAGCPKAPKVITKRVPGTAKESKMDVKFHVSPTANANNPVALDLVLVSDKNLLKELQKMTASQWFERREQIILDHPKVGDLVVVGRWEWAPGQVVPPTRLVVQPEVKAGLIFANYFSPGEHRAIIDPRAHDILIKLEEDKLEVVTQK